MDIGVMIFPTDLTPSPAWLAAEAESRGLESLWFPEHTHIPTSRKTPWPGGEPLPEQYRRTLDPFVALASAAAVTTDAEARHRHLPRRPARPDRAGQGGRLASTSCPTAASCSASASAGTSTRWSTTASTRSAGGPTCARTMLAMKELWTKDEASYDGEFVHVLAELVVAQAGAAAAPAGAYGRGGRAHDVPPRGRVLRRLDADPRPPRDHPAPRRAARRGRGGRPRSRRPSSSACSACRRSRRRWRATATPGSPGSSSGCPQGDEAAILATPRRRRQARRSAWRDDRTGRCGRAAG